MPSPSSTATFKTFIEDLHEHGVPSRIDRSVLTRFSGIVGTQLMHALRFLSLVEDKKLEGFEVEVRAQREASARGCSH